MSANSLNLLTGAPTRAVHHSEIGPKGSANNAGFEQVVSSISEKEAPPPDATDRKSWESSAVAVPLYVLAEAEVSSVGKFKQPRASAHYDNPSISAMDASGSMSMVLPPRPHMGASRLKGSLVAVAAAPPTYYRPQPSALVPEPAAEAKTKANRSSAPGASLQTDLGAASAQSADKAVGSSEETGMTKKAVDLHAPAGRSQSPQMRVVSSSTHFASGKRFSAVSATALLAVLPRQVSEQNDSSTEIASRGEQSLAPVLNKDPSPSVAESEGAEGIALSAGFPTAAEFVVNQPFQFAEADQSLEQPYFAPARDPTAVAAPRPQTFAQKELELQLTPGEIGTISVTMKLSGDALSVAIKAQRPSALAAIEKVRHVLLQRLTSAETAPSLTLALSETSASGPNDRNAQTSASPFENQSDGKSAHHRFLRDQRTRNERATPDARTDSLNPNYIVV